MYYSLFSIIVGWYFCQIRIKKKQILTSNDGLLIVKLVIFLEIPIPE